jgi:hypothetical protein
MYERLFRADHIEIRRDRLGRSRDARHAEGRHTRIARTDDHVRGAVKSHSQGVFPAP